MAPGLGASASDCGHGLAAGAAATTQSRTGSPRTNTLSQEEPADTTQEVGLEPETPGQLLGLGVPLGLSCSCLQLHTGNLFFHGTAGPFTDYGSV